MCLNVQVPNETCIDLDLMSDFILIVGVELNSDSKRGVSSPFVSAGIAFAVQQLLYATNASTTIARQFGQLVTDIGHFLIAKLTCKDDSCAVNSMS